MKEIEAFCHSHWEIMPNFGKTFTNEGEIFMDWILDIWNWVKMIWNRLFDGFPQLLAEHDYTSMMPPMALYSLFIGLLGVFVVLGLLYMLRKWRISGKLLTTLFCITWMMGFIIYEIGIYTVPKSLFLNAPI